ncbi:MAG: hypothetical protein JSV91_08680 [Phycisphaerales bacterium]|nr:MAG: hypothetical protein JSV91_08680 [Phycisphaerales bacterium]
MEFVDSDDVKDLLRDQEITEVPSGEERVHMRMADGEGVVHLHLVDENCQVVPRDGATVVDVPKDRLPDVVEDIVHKLRLDQVLLIPVGKWRDVFDAVAFSLAGNEDWQEFDAASTIQLNTRDPLLCEPGDFQTFKALMRALVSDAEDPQQGLMVLTTTAPVLLEFVPDGAVRVSVGQQVLADEVAEVFES